MTDFAATQTDDQAADDVVMVHTNHSRTCALVALENADQNLDDAGQPNTYADQINAAVTYLRTVELAACPHCC